MLCLGLICLVCFDLSLRLIAVWQLFVVFVICCWLGSVAMVWLACVGYCFGFCVCCYGCSSRCLGCLLLLVGNVCCLGLFVIVFLCFVWFV